MGVELSGRDDRFSWLEHADCAAMAQRRGNVSIRIRVGKFLLNRVYERVLVLIPETLVRAGFLACTALKNAAFEAFSGDRSAG